MNKLIRTISFCLTLLIASCYSTSGLISMDDKSHFKEVPKIVTKANRYFLRFRYTDINTFSFYMMTDSKIEGAKLIFYLPVTSSSGNMTGKLQFEEIVTRKKIQLIKESLVFWEEPNKKLIPIRIENMEEDLDVLATSSKGKNH